MCNCTLCKKHSKTLATLEYARKHNIPVLMISVPTEPKVDYSMFLDKWTIPNEKQADKRMKRD